MKKVIKMKLSVYFLSLLMIGLMFSCEKSDIDFEDDIEKSEKAWKAFRSSSGNSYKYVVSYLVLDRHIVRNNNYGIKRQGN